jgi:hypothetical protein
VGDLRGPPPPPPHTHTHLRYSFEVNLPTVVLPKRLDGPARVREIEMRFTVSRAIITNAMSEANPRGQLLIREYHVDNFYCSLTSRSLSQPSPLLPRQHHYDRFTTSMSVTTSVSVSTVSMSPPIVLLSTATTALTLSLSLLATTNRASLQ